MYYRSILTLIAALLVAANLSAQKNIKLPDSYNYNRALEAIGNEQYRTAMEYLDAELGDHPKNGYAYGWQCYIYNKHEMYEQALETANKSLKYLPKKDTEFAASIYAGRARTYLALEDSVSALSDFKTAMTLNPDEGYIYEHINILDNQERYEEEKADIDILLKKRPNDAEANVYIGRYYCNVGKYDSALQHHSHAARLSPNYSAAYAFRADVYIKQEKWREAAEDVAQALSVDADPKAWRQMMILAAIAPTHIMTSLKTKALKESDNHYWPYYLGIVHGIQEKHQEAIDYFLRAIDMSGHDENVEENASYRLAKEYQTLGQNVEALTYIDTAIRLDSTYARYYQTRAELHYDMGKTDLAIEDATTAIRLSPESSYAYTIRGSFRLWGGYFLNAIDDFTMALTMDETDASAYLYRATAYRKMGRESEALTDLKAIVQLPDEDNEQEKASAHAMLGHKLEAKEYAEKAFTENDANDYYNRACLYSLLGDTGKALDAFEQALELGHNEFWHYAHDYDLDNIRELPRFKSLMKKYQIEAVTPASIEVIGKTVTTEVPFTKESGIYKVKCTINELPLHFYFDTGASDVTLSSVEAAFMLKNGYLKPSDLKGSQYYGTASGEIAEGTTVILREVNFGGFHLSNIKASVVHSQKAPLLLGQTVLSRLGKIEIDYENSVLKITHKQ